MTPDEARDWMAWLPHQRFIEALAKDGYIWWQQFGKGKWRQTRSFSANAVHRYMTDAEYKNRHYAEANKEHGKQEVLTDIVRSMTHR